MVEQKGRETEGWSISRIVMMIISMVFLWGGLAFSILHLMKHPEELDDVLEEVKDHHTL